MTPDSLRKKLLNKLEKIPGLEEKVWPDRDDGFSSLLYNGKDFAHFHHDHELDVRMTTKVIRAEGLVAPTGSKNHPKRSKNSPWIELQFYHEDELDNLIRLIKLAIQQIKGSSSQPL